MNVSICLRRINSVSLPVPQVQQVYYVTGDFDFLLVINVRDMAEYEALTRELFFCLGKYQVFPDHRVDAKCEAGNDGHYRVSRVKVEMVSQRTPRRGIYFRNPPFPVRNLLV